MRKIFVLAFLATSPFLCFAQQNNLEGTQWVGVDGLQQVKFEMTLLPSGVYKYSTYDKEGNKVLIDGGVYTGTWEQNGSSIIMRNRFAEKKGMISGKVISGSATSRGGQSWNWSYQLVNNLIPEAEKRVEPTQALQSSTNQNPTNSQLQLANQIKPKSQEITSNQARTSNKESLEKQAYCFGAFNGLQNLNIGFNQSGNNEYFKRYKKEFYDVYTPIMDRIEQCQRANRDTSMNMALQCAKKMSEKEYRLFRESTAGYMDVYEASQKRDMIKIGSIRAICSAP